MRRLLRRAVVAGAVAIAGFLAWLLCVWPPPSWWRSHWPAETAFMAMRGRQYRAAHDSVSRRYRPVPLDSMSPWLAQAAIVAEDDAFYAHRGIDWRSLREALGYRRATFSWGRARDRAELWRALGRAGQRRSTMRGASTITQQLAKNLYLSPSRNPLRKLKEAVIAYRLEWALDKHRILELYLNSAELGRNVWGVEAASERYFHRSAARLSMEQAALLVATLPHPLTSNPVLRPGRTVGRQQLILRRLRGDASVAIPREEPEPATPPAGPVVDSGGLAVPAVLHAPPPTDSAAAPASKPDTAADRPPSPPPPPP